jgi:hypothetical protein
MGTKKWFQSKAIIAGVIGVLIAIYNSAGPALAAGCLDNAVIDGIDLSAEGLCYVLPQIPDWVYGILGGLGIYGRASAKTTIK